MRLKAGLTQDNLAEMVSCNTSHRKDLLVMKEQTDMAGVIEIAETFLDREYTYIPDAVFNDIDHPFTSNSISTVIDIDSVQALNTDNFQLPPFAEGCHPALNIVDSPEAWELFKRIKREDLHKCDSP